MGLLSRSGEAPELPEPEDDTEAKRVTRWRKRQLVKAGYGMTIAGLIAGAHYVDLHQACRLIERGASEDVAAKILL